MILYLAIVARGVFPAACVVALLASRIAAPRRAARLVVCGALGAVLAGAVGHEAAFARHAVSELAVALRLAALFFTVLALSLVSAPLARSATGRVVAALLGLAVSALSGFQAMELASERSFTATGVLNTEAIVNAAGVGLGLVVVLLAGVALAHAAYRVHRLADGVLFAVLAVLAVLWCGELMLAALQRDWLEVTTLRVRLVAWATAAAPGVVYALMLAGAGLAIAAFVRRSASAPPVGRVSPEIGLRLLAAHRRGARRWRNLGLACVAMLAVGLTYQDVYASRPPTLSEATRVAPDDAGNIRIGVASVADGNLHRFDFIASDGHRVRFFLINRYDAEHVRLGVVFDTCMICGDKGYIQEGNEIICISCNVHLFRPSIGKPGGCNPVPLDHEVDGDAVVIAANALERGAKYFSEVVEIAVADPVSGAKLLNTKAPYQYEFRGRTFFFESQANYDAFRASPETYAADTVSRLWRVQGHVAKEG
jgi:uncharacterized membrane protein/YHS domain-containing protein